MDSQEFRDHKAVAEAHTRLVKSVEVLAAVKALGAHAGTTRTPRGQLLGKVEGMALDRAFDALEKLAADPVPATGRPADREFLTVSNSGVVSHYPAFADLSPLLSVEDGMRVAIQQMPVGVSVGTAYGVIVCLPAGTMKKVG